MDKGPLTAEILYVSPMGVMVIEYNRNVIRQNVTGYSILNAANFSVSLEQRSDEPDQTTQFNYEVLNMTKR